MEYILLEYLYTLLYVVGITFVLLFVYRKNVCIRVPWVILCVLGYGAVLSIVTAVLPEHSFWYVIVNLVTVVLDFIYSCILIRKKNYNNIFVTIVYFSIYGTVGINIMNGLMYYEGLYLIEMLLGFYRFFISISSNFFAIIVSILFVKNINFIYDKLPKKYIVIYFLINIIEAIFVIFICVLMINGFNYIYSMLSVLSIAQIIIVNNYIVGSNNMYVKNQEHVLTQFSNELMLERIKELELHRECLLKERHDYKNRLLMVSMLQDDKEALMNYVQSLLGKETREISFCTGNSIIDACLNVLIKTDSGLNYDINVMKLSNYDTNAGKLCSVLFNLIDNANAAAYNSKQKYVSISLEQINQLLCIKIDNSVDELPTFESTKGDGHGYGMTIINEIVEGSGGFIDYECSDELVKVTVLLNINEK